MTPERKSFEADFFKLLQSQKINLSQASFMSSLGMWKEALTLFEDPESMDRKDSERQKLSILKLRSLFETEQYAHCISFIQSQKFDTKTWPHVSYWLGRAFEELNMLRKARQCYEATLKAFPKHLDAISRIKKL